MLVHERGLVQKWAGVATREHKRHGKSATAAPFEDKALTIRKHRLRHACEAADLADARITRDE